MLDRRHGELTTVRVVAATRRCAQEKATEPKQRGSTGSVAKTSPLTFQMCPKVSCQKYDEVMSEYRGDCSVYGRRSCRFLLHLSVPEGLQTLCTEFGGVAQNAKWTLLPRPRSERPHNIHTIYTRKAVEFNPTFFIYQSVPLIHYTLSNIFIFIFH